MQSDVPYELGDKIFIRGRSNSWELQTKADVELANHAYAEGRKAAEKEQVEQKWLGHTAQDFRELLDVANDLYVGCEHHLARCAFVDWKKARGLK